MGFSLEKDLGLIKYNKNNPQAHILEFTFGGIFIASISLLFWLAEIRTSLTITIGSVLQLIEIVAIGVLTAFVNFKKSRVASTLMVVYWSIAFIVYILSLQGLGRIIMSGFLLWVFILGMIATYQIQAEK